MVTLKLLYYQVWDRLIHGNWTFSTKAKLPTATASDHRATRTDNSSRRAISIHWRPVQQWIFHQAEQELTTLPGLRYSSGHRKGRLKILSISVSVAVSLGCAWSITYDIDIV